MFNHGCLIMCVCICRILQQTPHSRSDVCTNMDGAIAPWYKQVHAVYCVRVVVKTLATQE